MSSEIVERANAAARILAASVEDKADVRRMWAHRKANELRRHKLGGYFVCELERIVGEIDLFVQFDKGATSDELRAIRDKFCSVIDDMLEITQGATRRRR